MTPRAFAAVGLFAACLFGGPAARAQAPAGAPPTTTSYTTTSPPPQAVRMGTGKRYTTWDADIQGGFGRAFTDPGQWTGFGRLRGGLLWVRDPSFFALGATYEISNVSAATLGIQGEWMNLETGIWLRAGPFFDVAHGARPGVLGAVGWSVVGVEVQARDYADSGFAAAVFATLRVPIGIIAFGLRGR